MSDIRIATPEDQILLEKEAKYCSYGDTVHYIEPPRIFSRCEGSYVWDTEDQAYLDLQMWYSAVNFGYANPRLNNALKKQIDTLPQIASQYLHKGKIELSEMIAVDAKNKFGLDGRVHFNVGGSQSIEDSLKVVRNASNGKSLMFAFEGGYHGRTLGASSITSTQWTASSSTICRDCRIHSLRPDPRSFQNSARWPSTRSKSTTGMCLTRRP